MIKFVNTPFMELFDPGFERDCDYKTFQMKTLDFLNK